MIDCKAPASEVLVVAKTESGAKPRTWHVI